MNQYGQAEEDNASLEDGIEDEDIEIMRDDGSMKKVKIKKRRTKRVEYASPYAEYLLG